MEYRTDIDYRFEIPKGRRTLMLIVYISMILLGGFILYIEYYGLNKGSSKALIGIISVIWGATSSIQSIRRLIRFRDLNFELGPKGIFDRRICDYIIPWSEIKNISTWTRHGNSVLVLEFTSDFENTQINTIHHFISKLANRLFGAKGRVINPLDFELDFDTFNKLVHAYARAHNSPAAKPLT